MSNEHLKVIYDCDNTTGIDGRDVDDGLTLLYLNKCPEIDLLGNTLTFGNGTVAEVANQSHLMKELFDLKIEQYPGLEKEQSIDISQPSPAAKFLVNQVNQYPRQVTILATGSMNNLYEASLIDERFFKKVKQIVIMGGIFEPLFINGVPVDELNLSVSNIASEAVLNSGCKLILVSGQFILDGILSGDVVAKKMAKSNKKSASWLDNSLNNWFKKNVEWWDLDGTINWDGITAEAMLDLNQFIVKDIFIHANQDNLKSGLIDRVTVPNGHKITIVYQIKNMDQLNDKLISKLNLYR
ncbi:nucleoside hydrolase [Companilactobacillus zhongbaensis]|uniref:nucleoside hydrolase n=1 Tax=Companilactobacillus zhongbaensis TaxID=2486009 RepID=UPI000F7A68AD|nr:nucleoside hydrolase [Companilactobacillus zhongbaensis]